MQGAAAFVALLQPGNDSGVRGALAVVGLACLDETGYWALRAELIVYLC